MESSGIRVDVNVSTPRGGRYRSLRKGNVIAEGQSRLKGICQGARLKKNEIATCEPLTDVLGRTLEHKNVSPTLQFFAPLLE